MILSLYIYQYTYLFCMYCSQERCVRRAIKESSVKGSLSLYHVIGVFAIINRVCLLWREIRGILTMLSLSLGQSMRMGFFEIMRRDPPARRKL